ncbi:MAG TPA: FTR1 family protein [Acidimicrobiales bacterium]|nr:FTR1 family protein [Acidimicrobiales bacterium]
MIAAFVIFLREGVEASMIVAILLAYLNRTGQRRHFRDVFAGVGAALALALGGGLAAYFTIHNYAGSRVQTIFETITFLLAAAVLTYMTFWMRAHAPRMSGELRGRVDAALDRKTRTGLSLLAFQAVGREGLETVVFTLALAFSATGRNVLVGGAAGLVVALAVAVFIYRLGHKLNLGRFFAVVGALLMVFAAGLLSDAVQNMQQLGWFPFLTHALWNTGHVLSEDSALGDLLHSFFGYAEHPTVGQPVVYTAYLAVVLFAYFRLSRRARRSAPAARAHPAAAARPAPAAGGERARVSSV